LLQRLAAFAVADQQQTCILGLGECAQEHVETLEVAQPANGEDADFAGRPVGDRKDEG